MNRNIKLLTWFNFFTDFRPYAPIAVVYFSQVSGSFAAGMGIFSVVQIANAIFEVPTGVFSDLIGRKKTIMFGALSSIAAMIFYGAASSFWLLAAGAIFEGLSRSFYSGNNDAFLHDTLVDEGKGEDFSKHYGKTNSMFQLALAISAIVGSVAIFQSIKFLFLLGAAAQTICFGLSILMQEPKARSKESSNIFVHMKEALSKFKNNWKLRYLSLGSIVQYGLGETGYQFQAAFFQTVWPLWAINIAKTIANMGSFISFRIASRTIKRFHPVKLMIFGFAYTRIINIFAIIVPTVISPLLMTTTSLFFGIVNTAKSVLFQKEFSEKERATMASFNSLFHALFFSVSALIVGALADQIGPAKAYLVLQLVMFSVIYLWMKILRFEKI